MIAEAIALLVIATGFGCFIWGIVRVAQGKSFRPGDISSDEKPQWAAIRTNGFAWYFLDGPFRSRRLAEAKYASWPRVRIVPWLDDEETTLHAGVVGNQP